MSDTNTIWLATCRRCD